MVELTAMQELVLRLAVSHKGLTAQALARKFPLRLREGVGAGLPTAVEITAAELEVKGLLRCYSANKLGYSRLVALPGGIRAIKEGLFVPVAGKSTKPTRGTVTGSGHSEREAKAADRRGTRGF